VGEAKPLESELGGALRFMRLLWAVDHGLQSASKNMSARTGITGPQRLVVRVLGQADRAVSAGELARVLHLHPSTLTGVLRRLEGRRWIERRPDPTDQRRSLLRLTAAGRKLDSLRRGTVEATVRKVLSRFPERQLDDVSAVLIGLADALAENERAALRREVLRSRRPGARVAGPRGPAK
jgi:DNA-binding MarR family transcriptional regulator